MPTWNWNEVTRPVARYDYECQLYPAIAKLGLEQHDLSAQDWATWERVVREKGTILRGSQYLCVRGRNKGEPDVFRARLDLVNLYEAYGLEAVI